MAFSRATTAVSMIGALVAGALMLAGPSAAQAGSAGQAPAPAAVKIVHPDVIGFTYGPYSSLGACRIDWLTVAEGSPPPLSETNCFGSPGDYYFVAYYDV